MALTILVKILPCITITNESFTLLVSPPYGLIVGIIIPVVIFIIVLVLTILKTLKWAKRKKEFFEKLGQVGVKNNNLIPRRKLMRTLSLKNKI